MSEPLDHEPLAVLVHEVRSPVAALSAIAGTLTETSVHRPDRVELVRLAITACRAIERVVVDAVVTSVRWELLDPAGLVRDAAAAAALTGASVEGRIASDLPKVSGDPFRLRQALDNLVENALVHSGGDTVVIGASATGDGVRLFVSDPGTGIPAAEQERIFESGVRLDAERRGSGLGLAIVRAIAEAHGGTVTVSSSPGKGSTFMIVLPLS